MPIEDILVSPIDQTDLPLERLRTERAIQIDGYTFTYDGVYNLTPSPPPHEDVRANWSLWEKLQANGLVAYTEVPSVNLAVQDTPLNCAFRDFAMLYGSVLDVGCGPQKLPVHARTFSGRFVGIDPLRGEQERHFEFVQGIAEYLPFRNATFDQILFVTTLDHMLSPQRALREARRVLQPSGEIIVFYGDVNPEYIVINEQHHPLIHKVETALRLARRRDWRSIRDRVRASSVNPFAYIHQLSIPQGACDHFHFFHVEYATLAQWLQNAGFVVTQTQTQVEGTNAVFVRARIISS
jgi:SAM-dependent methyltransferase